MVQSLTLIAIVTVTVAATAAAVLVTFILIDAALELIADLAARRHYAALNKEG